MYKRANAEINRGLSLGARMLLGSMAALSGLVMVLTAPTGEPRVVWFYSFGALCFLIMVACFTSGRVRQFIGSLIGCTIFLAGAVYLAVGLSGGTPWSDNHTSPSVYNAVMYLLSIGVPGVAYAYKVRFGFRRAPR